MIWSIQPTQAISSVFITIASCTIPLHTEISSVSFQYIYASEDFVPAVSACMMLQNNESFPAKSGNILQKALG